MWSCFSFFRISLDIKWEITGKGISTITWRIVEDINGVNGIVHWFDDMFFCSDSNGISLQKGALAYGRYIFIYIYIVDGG